MKRFTLALLILFTVASAADAGPFRRRSSGGGVSSGGGGYATCQEAAEAMASRGTLSHLGNPTGTYEGIGFSTSSPDAALAACCYSRSSMRVVDSAVVRGRNGYYAVKRYSR